MMWSGRLIDSLKEYNGYVLAYVPQNDYFYDMIANKIPDRDFTADTVWYLGEKIKYKTQDQKLWAVIAPYDDEKLPGWVPKIHETFPELQECKDD